ncbi:DUF4062 domain-containing protein [Elizabethkingia anophelis]|uniref:DUF4062 domain-containing protein n=3 Tax=Elizabethkingia anophelis TaxID=1117645 RepID=A0ABM6MQT2_9FLAO|nr:DUF4062 domain-containing protein [Elizabethkingia anophelis]ATC35441.1 DUF4062 domain-containing protein [Elizabethkingia anophelis R26]ATC39079.1 DUF4062 domain-containing protein [Elizabethkingia anophelis Ag1]ATC42760.1 DUF4062 domain-containing protein [Elizabethkingia anophelis]ATC46436.1 DUF4062 domain-containing protein [Elizabethkingia anophelis]ELR78743.1 hypothetical protein D505_13080 [Elizabethkingia anophelis R26]
MNNLNIFVSSTCYDLSQLRANLSDFINTCGHNPVLSEYNNFPISTELNTIENCLKNVKENADIFVLVVGSRYGSTIETGKSITNIEFLTAKQKGIPIFCFIDKSILSILNVWKNNRDADFSNIVDNTKIFEFIYEIRTKENLWVFPFEQSRDIIDTLKIQLSNLFKDSLKVKNILDKNIDDFFKLNLTERCLKILIERNNYFEIEFLYQTFMDELKKKEFLKNDIEYSILIEPKHFISDLNELANWGVNRLNSLNSIINNLANLFPILSKFIGDHGQPSDIKGLYYSSIKYSYIFEQLLNWIIDIKSTHITEEYSELKVHLADIPSNIIDKLWDYPHYIKSQLDNIKEQNSLGNPVNYIDLYITLEVNTKAQEKFHQTLNEIKNWIQNQINTIKN